MLYTTIESPVGPLLLAGYDQTLYRLSFLSGRKSASIPAGWLRVDDAFGEVRRQLQEYFDGARREFDVPLALDGNQFELSVWAALCEIPYGATVSYGDPGPHFEPARQRPRCFYLAPYPGRPKRAINADLDVPASWFG